MFEWTEQTKDKVIEILVTYFTQYGNSECIAQGIEAQIRATEIMCEIADMVNPIN